MRNGIVMANTIELKPADVYTITIGIVNSQTGLVEPAPVGDVFSAVSPSPAVEATIGVDADGKPAVIVRALTMPDANTMGIVIPVTDSAGDVATSVTVNYAVPVASGDITLNMAGAVVTAQPAPSAPGP
jgi:hypothetical protein